MELSSREYYIDGICLPVVEAGDITSTEAIVFIHGFPGSADDWSPYMKAMSSSNRVVSLNMPGFGDADKPKKFSYTVDSYLPIISSLLDKMKIIDVHFVLHDFGGAWGLKWAENNLNRVSSVVLINTGMFLGEWHSLAKVYRAPVIGDVFSMLSPLQFVVNIIMSNNGARRLSKKRLIKIKQLLVYGTRRAMKNLYRNTELDDESDSLSAEKISAKNIPAMVIWGSNDRFLDVIAAEKQRRAFPAASVHILEDCGHWPLFEDQQRVMSLLIDFYQDNTD